ncbi:conserved hypothetical protein [Paecilomyces variotii No. 5]|uniref:Cysteine-rich transmembrane CYSTM domain-containing protein n=1 Tax=Byssochlamys spectabilis (strain No. 5 / NBRC 109023) TaxID=1356009 RepID=V5FZK2_BYSSN|nr:conserved hypothetical protein [Paecilomyces variotii No. 5]
MFGDGAFSWFKSSKQETAPERTWNPNTMTAEQPTSPAAPTTERVVTEQPGSQEQMSMQMRGGAGCGDVCCGVCAGLCCFECFEECC